MIYDFLCKSSVEKKLSRRESIKKQPEFLFSGFNFREGKNACFNKVFKLTVTNNFQFCLWGKNLSAKCIKNFISKKGEKRNSIFLLHCCKSRRYTITSQKRHKNAKTAKDERWARLRVGGNNQINHNCSKAFFCKPLFLLHCLKIYRKCLIFAQKLRVLFLSDF